MFVEISLITIGTALVVSKILRRIKVADAETQTDSGLWLPQMVIYFEDSESESVLEMDEMELINEYVSPD